MILPAGGGNGAPPGVCPDEGGGFEPVAGSGVGVLDGTAEDGRDHPPMLLGWGVAVSFAVTKRG